MGMGGSKDDGDVEGCPVDDNGRLVLGGSVIASVGKGVGGLVGSIAGASVSKSVGALVNNLAVTAAGVGVSVTVDNCASMVSTGRLIWIVGTGVGLSARVGVSEGASDGVNERLDGLLDGGSICLEGSNDGR
jgi:hypothetical protein